MGVNKNILLKEYRILEIKEKYGTLRWYDNGSPTMSKINDIIDYYEDLSMCYCINCGKPVRYKTLGYITYVCPECFSNYADKICGADLKEFKAAHKVTVDDIPTRSVLTSEGWTKRGSDVDFKTLWGLEEE